MGTNNPKKGTFYQLGFAACLHEETFEEALRRKGLDMPKRIESARSDFERGWRDAQTERVQQESIIQAAATRRLAEKTIQLIAQERRRIVKEMFQGQP